MANPPFAGDIKETRILHKYEIAYDKKNKPKKKLGRDILFIERNLDSNDVIKLRLENAKKELDIAYEYDCMVLNDDFNRAFEALKSIIFFKKEIQDDTQNKKILRDLLS